ncbi:Keratin, type II cytoskeletal 8 [Microtus ochrogaster]|uniref:Keratin, type II cytoskeletal 8 n=1 Tax=Microtus ochrogaster TaxID=79684 RepID=A0A8J6GI71_MICOH|nr:Keratin, type II cytoskeletal 8 [Microtus ochrogaster]
MVNQKFIKDGKAYLTKPEAIVQQVKQVIVQTLHEDCELVSFKLVAGTEITTYCKLLEAERDWESGRQNFGFHMKIIDGYSGGSSSVYMGLRKPGSSDGVGSFHPSFSSAGSSVLPRLW